MGVQVDLPFFINASAIAVMIVGLFMVLGLRSKIRGGSVGNAWKILTGLVILFTLGYLATPFFGLLPADSVRSVFALIFLFGAVYVVVTVRLVHRIIDELA
ncbi:MAG: hypothetical protein KGL42_09830 [Betaproteobacteria bacterium]|jgi:hypothetical protein|nr:hypothetical protein [Betaproteobacteria bacterium]